ncbi:MAG: nucleotidyl transferase AbiEii/AbiGii toxin family protein [Anaerolineae bacterium]
MNYQTGYAFRRALEARLLKQSTEGSLSLVRLRKLIAFDRFLARLLAVQPDGWLLMGGLALQLRLGQRARTTKDVDVLLRLPRPEIGPTLLRAANLDLGDWFSFMVQRDPTPLPGLADGGWRFFVNARLSVIR